MSRRYLGMFAGVFLVLAIVGTSVLRTTGFFIHDIYRVQEWLGGDKMTHALMGAAFVIAVWLFLSGGRSVARMRKAFGLALLLVLLEEGSQALIPNRSFSLSDLAMGVVGAATVYLFGCFIMSKLPSA